MTPKERAKKIVQRLRDEGHDLRWTGVDLESKQAVAAALLKIVKKHAGKKLHAS